MDRDQSYDQVESVSRSLDDGVISPSTRIAPAVFSEHRIGTIMCLIGVLILTPDTLFLRMLSDIPIFPIIFYRHLFIAASCTAMLLLYQQTNAVQKVIDVGKMGFLAGLVILASNPMFSAVLSYFLLGEVVKLHTFVASLVCFAAIVVISITAIGSSSDTQAVIGILAAIGSTVTLSLYFVLIRVTEKVNGVEPDCLVLNIISGLFGAIVSLIISEASFPPFSNFQWPIFVIDAAVLMPLSFILLTIGPKYIPAAEVSLCTLLETALGPLMVYLGGYEKPTYYAIGGGAALIAALAVHSVISLREPPTDKQVSTSDEADMVVSEDKEEGKICLDGIISVNNNEESNGIMVELVGESHV